MIPEKWTVAQVKCCDGSQVRTFSKEDVPPPTSGLVSGHWVSGGEKY